MGYNAAEELNNIGIIDVYELPEETSVTVRFTFSAFERTLTMDEVQKNIETITKWKERIRSRIKP